jgi:hypothetical protein
MNCSGAACGTNDFSARVSTSGTVSSENVDWINGNCSMSGTSSARATCTFNTSLFSVTPNCTLTAYACPSESGGCPRTINVASLNTSTIVTQGVQNNDLAYQPSDMVISCHRVGSDRVAANMPLIAGGVTSLSSSTMFFDGAYVTAAGAVTEIAGADWISQTSITPSSSTYTITFTKPYATHPGCKAYFSSTAPGLISGTGAVQVTDINTTGLIVRTFNTTFSAANMPFYIECYGPR